MFFIRLLYSLLKSTLKHMQPSESHVSFSVKVVGFLPCFQTPLIYWVESPQFSHLFLQPNFKVTKIRRMPHIILVKCVTWGLAFVWWIMFLLHKQRQDDVFVIRAQCYFGVILGPFTQSHSLFHGLVLQMRVNLISPFPLGQKCPRKITRNTQSHSLFVTIFRWIHKMLLVPRHITGISIVLVLLYAGLWREITGQITGNLFYLF